MEVVLSKNAQKEYEHLSKSAQIKIRKKLEILKRYPYSGKKLTGVFNGIYSLSTWPYRILYEINTIEKRVEVHKVTHRQGVYK
jgi:mRNA-degrading endonuclease RelE of RelBE toxin-antitoxin system